MKQIIIVCLLLNMLIAKVDFDVSGEGVGYYQTTNDERYDLFEQEASIGSLGLQLDVEAKVDNGFRIGYQETFLGTLGLEDSLLSNGRQSAQANEFNGHAMTKLYLWKRFAKTTLKLGRQELSQDISPLAFSEDWNVFKNTFDAFVIKNENFKETSIVAAYIIKGNRHNDLSTFSDLSSEAQAVRGAAYMLTAVNNSFKETSIKGSYYLLTDLNDQKDVSVFWFDVKSEKNALDMAFQTAYIDPSSTLSKTLLLGAKVSKEYDTFALSLAYSTVSSGGLSFQNLGVKGDSALYTQMVNNQDHIVLNADAVLLKGSVKLPRGELTVQYGTTKDNSALQNDFSEFDVVYKFDWLTTKMFVGYIGQKTDVRSDDTIRFWSRYSF